MKKIKSCYNCKHLEYYESQEYKDEEFLCSKREYLIWGSEDKHNSQLEEESYRQKAKRCCELKWGGRDESK